MAEVTPEESGIVLCQFRVAKDREDELIQLCRDHDALLRKLDLITDTPVHLWVGADNLDRTFAFMTFTWKSAAALDAAHNHPEVQKIWEAMEPCCEARDGRPSMEFPHAREIALSTN